MSQTVVGEELIGQILDDRFEVVRLLGEGGMGRVFEGRHRLLGKRVAIKLLHAEFATNEQTVRRFLNEARAAATLGHPNILDATDVGTTPNGEPYIVIELLEGRSLKDLLTHETHLSLARTARIVSQICSALSAAHKHEIVHRDVKPDNVYLIHRAGNDEFVKLLDFGISKFNDGASALTGVGVALGTPSYMSPEQFLDAGAVDARADIYATSVLVYEMLSGELPFVANTFPELAAKVLMENPVPLQQLRPDLPADVTAAVMRGLTRDRNARMSSIDELRTVMEAHTASVDVARITLGNQHTVASVAPVAPSPARMTQREGTPEFAPRLSRMCPSCNERLGLDVQCPHCGAELSDPRLGQVVADRFRVDRLLGAGGMGRVYLGTHLQLQEKVAMKFLLAEWTARTEFRARFKREATLLAKLRHPGIVPVHDYGEHMDELYMVMEFVRGRPLRDSMERNSAMPLVRALGMIEQLLEVIEFAHAQGVIHRDLKPENVMLMDLGNQQDRLRVLDFGLALSTDPAQERLTAVGAMQGTPMYMSPEQCRGRDVGPPTDVYAIGVMLFELVCGEVPFRGNTMSDTVVQQMFVARPRVSERGARPDVPASIEALLEGALAKSPSERLTAGEMRTRIREILRGEDPTTRAQEAARERAAQALASREQRAVPRAEPAAPARPLSAGQNQAAVALWNISRERVDSLQPTFGVAGVIAREWQGEQPPTAIIDGQPLKGVLVPWTAVGQRCLQIAKATPHLAKIPIIVVDASDVDDTPSIIRAGATDVAYASASPEAVFKQVSRLMKRVK